MLSAAGAGARRRALRELPVPRLRSCCSGARAQLRISLQRPMSLAARQQCTNDANAVPWMKEPLRLPSKYRPAAGGVLLAHPLLKRDP